MPATHRHSGSLGPNGESPTPSSPNYLKAGRERNMQPGLEFARSPPQNSSSKNTKHVPCKFFRQGACQAGNACPFSHSLDPMMQQAPCKYFMKGNCKFGAKCALAHYLPNGHRVSRADLDPGMTMGGRAGFNVNNRSEAQPFATQEGIFPEPYMQQQYANQDHFPGQDQFLFPDDDFDAYDTSRYRDTQTASAFDNLNSPPTSHFGSPPSENPFPRLATDNIRSALNAPLPASFDANSLPHIAKYGPFGQSVPDKFGLKSPTTSTLSKKLASPHEFPGGIKSSIGSTLRNVSSPLSMSPQTGEDSMGGRLMHSSKSTHPRMISASVPRASLQGWDDNTGAETDLLPNSLHDEVLLPGERLRRMSRPDELSSSARDRLEGLDFQRRGSLTVGSPPMGSSPSRFRGLFEEQRKKEESITPISQNFGHVGSPLRESWMPHETAANPKGVQISGISQAMARMELKRTESTETNGSTRPPSGWRSNSNFSRTDRGISSPSLTSKRIEEEGEPGLFEMDDEGSKRNSTNWTTLQSPTANQTVKAEPAGKPSSAGGAITIKNGVKPVFGYQ